MDGSEQQIAATERARRRRGRGKPFVKGDLRINRRGVPRESLALAKLLRDTAADVLFSPCPRCETKTRITCILEVLAAKAERGDVRAAEVLFERVGGRPTRLEENVPERSRITIEWNGPPPEWAPKHMLEEYERAQKEPPALPEARESQFIEAEVVSHTEEISKQPVPQPACAPYSPVHPGHIFP